MKRTLLTLDVTQGPGMSRFRRSIWVPSMGDFHGVVLHANCFGMFWNDGSNPWKCATEGFCQWRPPIKENMYRLFQACLCDETIFESSATCSTLFCSIPKPSPPKISSCLLQCLETLQGTPEPQRESILDDFGIKMSYHGDIGWIPMVQA